MKCLNAGNAIFCPPENVDAWAQAIQTVQEDPDLAATAGRKGKAGCRAIYLAKPGQAGSRRNGLTPPHETKRHSFNFAIFTAAGLLIGCLVALALPGGFLAGLWGAAVIAAVSVFILLLTWRWAGGGRDPGLAAFAGLHCCGWRSGSA